jgi:RND superfamily putative drug exporter
VVISVAVGVLLVGFGIPFLRVDLQNGDAGLLPPSFESRQVADVLAEQLPDLGGEPVYVVARADADRLESYAASISARPEVRRAEVVPGRDGLASVEVLPRAEGEDQEVRDLVRALRAEETGFQTWVTGDAAALVDFTDEIERRMPFAGGFIAAATMLLLFLMTGSVLIPIKALVMNTLSLGASFGALVLVFQDGHLAEYLDVSPPGAVETWIPVLVFVFAFGLSMDYEVFLLARIKEMHDAGHPNDRAVELGLQYSGRIITAAAVLVIIVFAGFAAGEMLSIKELGLALALAVLIDATLVRCLLVPATMTLLGEANWWAPRPLRWLHGKLGLRESATVPVGSAAWPPPRPDTPFPPPRTAAGPAAGSTTEAASDPATESATGPRPRRLPRPLPGSAAERITAALADALAAGEIGNGGMPDRWVLIATTIDINGEIRPVPLASPGAHLHEILGLLDLGRVAWRENAHQRMWRDGKAH